MTTNAQLCLLLISMLATLAVLAATAPAACSEADALRCHATAFCDDFGSGGQCMCPEGSIGDGVSKQHGGSECSRESWALQIHLDLASVRLKPDGNRLEFWERDLTDFTDLLFLNPAAEKPSWFDRSVYHTVTDRRYVSIYALFFSKVEAQAAFDALYNHTIDRYVGPLWGVDDLELTITPKVTTFVSPTSEAEIRVLPTGMDVLNVYFSHDCMSSGCWVVDLIYTTGKDNFNVFYIPKAIGDDDLSYDFDYTAIPPYATPYGKSPADTFLPLNFPCGSDGYRPKPGTDIPDRVSACCLEEFTQMYRPVSTFITDPEASQVLGASRDTFCAVNATRKIWDSTHMPQSALFGNFSGMDGLASIDFKTVEDPFLNQYTSTVYLDEVALRKKAGILTGAVGVAHAIDTFVGFANFKPTGLEFLDMFASQTNIHLEKTNFFTVSAYGKNQYTFLEYVNLRLVAVYHQDNGFGQSGSASSFARTNSTHAAHYLQVTFTLGAQYQPIETGIIPIDSVLVSKGDFISSPQTLDTRFHACSQYHDGSFPAQALFDSRFPTDTEQTCAPNATMCFNPPHVPDQFVSFNVPLGVDWLPAASNDLDSNVFVNMVVSVIDARQIAVLGENPNHGSPAEQMKTTLSASIPVVEGGVYIFCDKITVKDDLCDVADADLILGSAGFDLEFSRLRIIKNILSGPFEHSNATRVDSDSIEAGLMTLVVKGNESYFARALGSSLEVEDVITIHVMEPATGTKFNQVLTLLSTPGEDLDIESQSFALNGAFRFTVDRAVDRARLEPTDALNQLCPFSPQRPNPDDAFPETCVARRDILAGRFPALAGKNATAIELPAAHVALDAPERADVARFMQLVLNPSDYSAELGRNFSYILAQKYALNGRFNRAFWINPGYEWTPTQTGRQEIFTLSQKLVMFALINLDEGFAGRRRMLLQSANPIQNSGAGISGQQVTFDTTPQSILANLYEIPEEMVATFDVQLQLTHQEACMPPSELRRALRSTLDGYVSSATAHHETVQVLSVELHKADVQCSSRRNVLRKFLSFSLATATIQMVVVFSPSEQLAINLQHLATMAGVNAVTPRAVSDIIQLGNAFVPATTYEPLSPLPPAQGDTVAQHAPGRSRPQPPARAAAVNPTIIAAIAGIGLVGLAGGYSGYKRYQTRHGCEVQVIASISVADLKAELTMP